MAINSEKIGSSLPQETLTNPKSLSVTTNDDTVENVTNDVLVSPEGSTYSEQLKNNYESDSDVPGDTDALTTMEAIMAYNRQLVARLLELEQKIEEQGDKANDAVKDTVKDLKEEVLQDHNKDGTLKSDPTKSPKNFEHLIPNYDRTRDAKGTNHSFEFPIGDMMMGSANFDTTPLEEGEDDQKQKESKKKNDDEETVKDENDSTKGGDIRIGDGDKDDIIIKVDATRKGVTFCIHIPRN